MFLKLADFFFNTENSEDTEFLIDIEWRDDKRSLKALHRELRRNLSCASLCEKPLGFS